MTEWLGIDVSKARLDVLLMAGGQKRAKAFRNDPAGHRALVEWLRDRRVHACMEATGRYGEQAAIALYTAGHAVSVVNPFQIKSFGKLRLGRNKTDPVDADLIAEYCRLFDPPLWTPPTAAMRRLRELVRLRESLKTAIVQWRNRAKAGELDVIAAEVIGNVIASLEAELARADAAVRAVIAADTDLAEDYKLLTTIPAIGSQAASIILVELPGPNVLRTARQAVAYAGLNPCQNRSGATERPTRISRIGNGNLRRALHLPALCAMRVNPAVRDLRVRLMETGRLRPQQIAVAAMRKLLHLCFGVLKTRKAFDPAYAQGDLAT